MRRVQQEGSGINLPDPNTVYIHLLVRKRSNTLRTGTRLVVLFGAIVQRQSTKGVLFLYLQAYAPSSAGGLPHGEADPGGDCRNDRQAGRTKTTRRGERSSPPPPANFLKNLIRAFYWIQILSLFLNLDRSEILKVTVFLIRIRSVCFWASWIRICNLFVRIWILTSTNKKWIEEWWKCRVPFKRYKRKSLEKKVFFVGVLNVTDEKSRFRSQSRIPLVRMYGSEDPHPDLYKNVTDPEHWKVPWIAIWLFWLHVHSWKPF